MTTIPDPSQTGIDLPNGLLITEPQLLSLIAYSYPGNKTQVNGLTGKSVYAERFYVSQEIYLNGVVYTPISFTPNVITGLYYTGNGVGVAVNGSNVAEFVSTGLSVNNEISTPGGADLSLNPSGPNIDCNGKTLINVSGLSANANKYDILVSSPITVVGATTSTLAVANTSAGFNYIAEVTCNIADITNNSSMGVLRATCSFKNIGGVVSINNILNIITELDATLVGCAISFAVSGQNVNIRITGVAGRTTKWMGTPTIWRGIY